MRTFLDFVRADVQMTLRNKEALFWAFFFPVLLMGLMGVVFGQENAFTAKLAIVNQDKGPVAATMVAVYKQVDALKVTEVGDQQQAMSDLRNGDYAAVLVLPAGLEKDMAAGTAQLPFYFDDSSPVEAGTVTGVVSAVVQKVDQKVSAATPKLELQAQGVAAKGFDYIDFLVPGIIAMAIMTNGIYGVSGSFVTYRQKGVLRRLKATPLPLRSFVGASVLVHLVRSLITAGLVLLVGVVLFGVNVTGVNVLSKTALLSLIGSGAFVALGFFIAAIARNTEIAAALAQVIATPMMFLSGIFFPMDNAPAWIQPVVKALPLTYLANALRDVIIKGHTLWFVRWDVLILTVTGVLFFGLSVRYFRWE
jgi:ABC-2 type transport system permease protein